MSASRAAASRRSTVRPRRSSWSTSTRLRPTPIIRGVSLAIEAGHAAGAHRPQRRRQIDAVQPDHRQVPGDSSGRIRLKGEDVTGLRPYEINRRGLSRSFQVTNIFPRLSVFENVRCSRALVARLPLFLLALRERRPRGAGADRDGAGAAQPRGAAPRAGRHAVLRRAARAGDRHHHRRRRRRDPARRADLGHEPQRDRARRPAHPPGDGWQDAAHGGARHERGLRPRRPDRGPGVRPGHRARRARSASARTPPSRRPTSASPRRRPADADRSATCTPSTARATSCTA